MNELKLRQLQQTAHNYAVKLDRAWTGGKTNMSTRDGFEVCSLIEEILKVLTMTEIVK